MRKKCSYKQKIFVKFVAEGQEFENCFRSLEQFTYSNSERSEQFLKQNISLICSWNFLSPNTSEQFKFKLGKIFGIQNLQEKLEKLGL